MSNIGKNIRKIRTVKKLSQAAFAEIFNLARPSIGAYEEERAEPKVDTIIQIANYFGISIDSLLIKELTINDLYNFNVHLSGGVKSIEYKKTNDLKINIIKTVLVPTDKQHEYIVHINNRDFISSLPKILIPKYHHKDIRAFEMNNNDMHYNAQGLKLGDFVFGEKLVEPLKFKTEKVYVIITNEKVIIRKVKLNKNYLELSPENRDYNNIEVKKLDVIEAWEMMGFFSTNIESSILISERIKQLEIQYDTLSTRLLKVEKNDN